MDDMDTSNNDGIEPKRRGSALFWLAGSCLVLLAGLAIGYVSGFGPGSSDTPQTPELSIATSDWLPKKPIELVVMAGEDGGADRLARVLTNVIETHRLSPQPIVVVNKGGESGGEAMSYLKGKAGDSHVLMMTVNSLYTIPLRRPELGLRLEDFTTVARLAEGGFVLWVNAESEIRTVDDYVAAVQAAEPGTWKMGATGSGNEDTLVANMLKRAYGLEHGYVTYASGGKVAEGLVNGEINAAVNTLSEQMAHFAAGKSRPLAVFTADRIPGLPDVPTFRELGHDLVYVTQRSILAAPGVPAKVQAYYEGLLHRASLTGNWRSYLQDVGLTHTFLPGGPATTYLLDERERHHKLLMSLEPTS